MFNKYWFDQNEILLIKDTFLNNRVLRKKPSKNDINFKKIRPLKNFKSNELETFAIAALKRTWPAIELATLAYDEAKIRVKKGGNLKVFNNIKNEFNRNNVYPILWLEKARNIIRTLATQYKNKKGIGSVYFVLVKGFMKKSQYYGCYVGQTKTTKLDNYSDNQTARLSQHFQGIRASKKVQSRGLEALWSLNCYTLELTNNSKKILEYESNIHKSLEGSVPKVLGDKLP